MTIDADDGKIVLNFDSPAVIYCFYLFTCRGRLSDEDDGENI
jgi:hypothetical protein